MKVTLKLHASLGEYLPEDAVRQAITLDVDDALTVAQLLDWHRIPHERVHLVLLNGVYVKPEDRERCVISDGDTLALWPPVAGG